MVRLAPMTLTRDAAYELLRSWTDSEALMTHARAVEVVMRAAAHRYGAGDADEERFGLADPRRARGGR